MERQPDRRGAGHQHPDDRADATATCGGRLRSRPDAQVQSQIGPSPDFRLRLGSQDDRAGLRIGPGWPRQMDAASLRRKVVRVADRRERQRQHDRADAQKNILQPHRKQQWVIAPEASAAFVANMEDVLEVYQRPHDPKRPLGLDETSKQLVAETRAPDRRRAGTQRSVTTTNTSAIGVANLFMMFAPLEGWRRVKVTDPRPPSITPTRSRICPTCIFPARTRSCWCRTISARIRLRRSARAPSRRRSASASSND